jgi:hypothetical protein
VVSIASKGCSPTPSFPSRHGGRNPLRKPPGMRRLVRCNRQILAMVTRQWRVVGVRLAVPSWFGRAIKMKRVRQAVPSWFGRAIKMKRVRQAVPSWFGRAIKTKRVRQAVPSWLGRAIKTKRVRQAVPSWFGRAIKTKRVRQAVPLQSGRRSAGECSNLRRYATLGTGFPPSRE